MSPRILPYRTCPRCGAELPQPTPRVCEECGASLQTRYLSWGCFSSAPPLVCIAVALWHLLRIALDGGGS